MSKTKTIGTIVIMVAMISEATTTAVSIVINGMTTSTSNVQDRLAWMFTSMKEE